MVLTRKPCTKPDVQIVCSVMVFCLQHLCLDSQQKFVNLQDIEEHFNWISFWIFYVNALYL